MFKLFLSFRITMFICLFYIGSIYEIIHFRHPYTTHKSICIGLHIGFYPILSIGKKRSPGRIRGVIQFICTFNAEIGRIDKALLRKGRLVDKYEFGKLDARKAEKLAELVYGRPMGITADMSLAEIFNMETDNHAQEPERKKVGF